MIGWWAVLGNGRYFGWASRVIVLLAGRSLPGHLKVYYWLLEWNVSLIRLYKCLRKTMIDFFDSWIWCIIWFLACCFIVVCHYFLLLFFNGKCVWWCPAASVSNKACNTMKTHKAYWPYYENAGTPAAKGDGRCC